MDGFRLTELIAAVSLATDLGTGQPMEHSVRTCRLSMAVADELGLDARAVADVYYVALLRFLGCTADAPEMAHYAGGDNVAFLAAMAPVYMGSTGEAVRTLARSAGRGQALPRRARLLGQSLRDSRSVVSHCEVGSRLAMRLGLGDGVVGALAHAYERWDGRGLPDGLAAEAVPVAVRVVVVARDAVLWQRMAGTEAAFEVLARRRGRAYDPAVVDAVRVVGLPDTKDRTVWADVLAAEPEPVRRSAPWPWTERWLRSGTSRTVEVDEGPLDPARRGRGGGRAGLRPARRGPDRAGSRRAGRRPRRRGRPHRRVGASGTTRGRRG